MPKTTAEEVKTGMAFYELGNCLRGWFGGEYASDDLAWDALSARFNRAFPSRGGRDIQMRKVIRTGKTAGGNETEQDRLLRERIERMLAEEAAQGTEAQRAETSSGSVHDGPVRVANAPKVRSKLHPNGGSHG